MDTKKHSWPWNLTFLILLVAVIYVIFGGEYYPALWHTPLSKFTFENWLSVIITLITLAILSYGAYLTDTGKKSIFNKK